jgi:hypothetical protein
LEHLLKNIGRGEDFAKKQMSSLLKLPVIAARDFIHTVRSGNVSAQYSGLLTCIMIRYAVVESQLISFIAKDYADQVPVGMVNWSSRAELIELSSAFHGVIQNENFNQYWLAVGWFFQCWSVISRDDWHRFLGLDRLLDPCWAREVLLAVFTHLFYPERYNEGLRWEKKWFSEEEINAQAQMMVEGCNRLFARIERRRWEACRSNGTILDAEVLRVIWTWDHHPRLQAEVLKYIKNLAWVLPTWLDSVLSVFSTTPEENTEQKSFFESSDFEVRSSYGIFLAEVLEYVTSQQNLNGAAQWGKFAFTELEKAVKTPGVEYAVIRPIVDLVIESLKIPSGTEVRDLVIEWSKNECMMLLGNLKASGGDVLRRRYWYSQFLVLHPSPHLSAVTKFCRGIQKGDEEKVMLMRLFLKTLDRRQWRIFGSDCSLKCNRLLETWDFSLLREVVATLNSKGK